MLLVVCVILAGVLQSMCTVCGIAWFVRHKQREAQDYLISIQREWFQHDEGKPHKAAMVLDAAGSVVGAAAARSIMASLGADSSHAAAAANRISDVVGAQQNPLMGLLSGGKRGKGAALMRLAELIGPMLTSKGNGEIPGGSAPTDRRYIDG
jgi:hypothetical protein